MPGDSRDRCADLLEERDALESLLQAAIADMRSGMQPHAVKDKYGALCHELARSRIKRGGEYSVPVYMDSDGARYATKEVVARYRSARVKGMAVADISCGVGIQAAHYAMEASSVVAMDIDPLKVALTRLNAESYNVDLEAHRCDALSTEALSLTASAEVIYSDPARPPEAPVRTLEGLLPPLDRVMEHYKKPFIFDLPPQIEMARVEAFGELEYISVGGSINRLTLYSDELSVTRRAAVSLPGAKRLEYNADIPRETPLSPPGDYIHEIDQAVYYARLLPELCNMYDISVVSSSKKRTLCTGNKPLSDAFIKATYEVIGSYGSTGEVRKALMEMGFGSVTLRFHVDPDRYWDIRNALQKGLKGEGKASLFLMDGTYYLAREVSGS